MKFILFYTRYAWVPQLIPILAGYKYYSWITNNYDRFYKPVNNISPTTTVSLWTFNKSNYYVRIYLFFTNRETLEVISNRGAQ